MRKKLEIFLKYFRIFLLLLILGTLIFIFVNSSLPPEVSDEQSTAVGGFITSFIPEDSSLYGFISEYIRKIAHFTEYGLLGIELSLWVLLYGRRRVREGLLSLAVPFFVGFADETVQIFSGRGPSISDVWIDIGGFVFFGAISYGVILGAYYLARGIVRRARKRAGRGVTNG
ncbi:MAG: VanZ family protein [Clostridia bacterium]|nr:VanZ family protein [Clostridia bacterium]